MSEWVVLELTPKAENEEPEVVRASIRHLLRDAEVFIPASVVEMGTDRLVKYLLEGYAFIKKVHPDERYFRLAGSKYVNSIVSAPTLNKGHRRVACVTDADIEKFREQIRVQEDQGIGVADLVVITSGPYKALKATVIELIPELDAVQVHVQLRSKESLVTLPRAFLRLHEKAAKPTFAVRFALLRQQVEAALTLATWEPNPKLGPLFSEWLQLNRVLLVARQITALLTEMDPGPLVDTYRKYELFRLWTERATPLATVLQAYVTHPDPTRMREHFHQLQRVTDWYTSLNRLAREVVPLYCEHDLALARLESTFVEYVWIADAHERLTTLLRDLDQLDHPLPTVQTVLIDGHNLAVRCATAPGLADLEDSQGRPTGAVVGFLNTLASLKGRFPEATFCVTWDGSSQRRKRIYPGYKANRGTPRATFEISFLQHVLPFFGVEQAWGEQEEADDALATLVKGAYAGTNNLILSTDRDLLQLVTPTTRVMVPAVGAGKERIYGPEEVEVEYGVMPERLPQLRALSGDTSDEIPGCPGCGLKTASKLINLYGTIQKLFSSNLAGLAKGMTQNLRASEAQVQLNVGLMTLVSDLPLKIVPSALSRAEAEARLASVDIKSNRILMAFFGGPAAVLHGRHHVLIWLRYSGRPLQPGQPSYRAGPI